MFKGGVRNKERGHSGPPLLFDVIYDENTQNCLEFLVKRFV
jgi:hypothetical protein